AGGRHTMTASLLIGIGASLGKEGKVDSMIVYYNRSLQIAEESQDPAATARALRLLSNHYEQEGQYAAAHELFRESIERSREFNGGEEEFGTLFNALGEYAEWGEWDVMGDLLERGDYVLAKANTKAKRSQLDRMTRDHIAMDFDMFRARRCMVTGHQAE